MTACQSTKTLTVSYQAVEVPAVPQKIEDVKDKIKTEPPLPSDIPPPGSYGASDIRAKKFGLYAAALRKWGRGLVTAIGAREAAAAILYERQLSDRTAALGRLESLKKTEPNISPKKGATP